MAKKSWRKESHPKYGKVMEKVGPLDVTMWRNCQFFPAIPIFSFSFNRDSASSFKTKEVKISQPP